MKIKQLSFLLLFLPAMSFAQIMVGPRVGLNLANQYKTSYTVPKTGINFGGVIDVQIVTNLSLQGEFMVSQKGYREEFKGENIFDELTATYFEVPVMAKYTYSKVNFAFYGMGGVYWAYWSSGRYRSSVDGTTIIVEDYIFQKDYDADGFKDNRSDFGIVAEIGSTYDNLGSGVLGLGLRYTYGLVATNNYQSPPPGSLDKRNSTITIALTYFFYL